MAANIVINDGQASPVAHTFQPQDRVPAGGGVVFQDIAGGVPDAYPTIILRGQMSPNGVFRAWRMIEVPVMETVSGTNAQGYQALSKRAMVLRARTEYTIDARASLAARNDLIAYDRNLNVPTTGQLVELLRNFSRPY